MAKNNKEPQDRLYELGNAPIGKLLFKYSLPAVIGTVVSAIYNIIDSIVIGHAIDDPNVVSGIAVTFPVMNLVTALGMLVGAGAAARVSIVMGQNDRRIAEIILGNCVQLSLIIGVAYATLFYIFMDPILKMFGASPNSLPYAREFMVWVLPGCVLQNLTFSFNNVNQHDRRCAELHSRAVVPVRIPLGHTRGRDSHRHLHDSHRHLGDEPLLQP